MSGFTKQAIQASFLKLLDTYPLRDITVRIDHRGLRDQPQILLLSRSGYFHQLCTLRQGMTEHLLRRIHTGVDDL